MAVSWLGVGLQLFSASSALALMSASITSGHAAVTLSLWKFVLKLMVVVSPLWSSWGRLAAASRIASAARAKLVAPSSVIS